MGLFTLPRSQNLTIYLHLFPVLNVVAARQVPMLSASPWLIPALAAYGLTAVGTPYLILMKAKGKWEESTTKLNDGFWGEWAGPDVYVDAIKGWTGLSCDEN